MGRAVAPGPFVPTVAASAILAAAAPADVQARYLPGLADGSVIGAAALGGETSSCRAARRAGPQAWCWAGAWRACCWSPWATTWRSST